MITRYYIKQRRRAVTEGINYGDGNVSVKYHPVRAAKMTAILDRLDVLLAERKADSDEAIRLWGETNLLMISAVSGPLDQAPIEPTP